MEIIIRIYDRERLLEAKLQSGETCTIGKAAGCTIQLAAACLGKPLPELIKKSRHLYFLLFGYYADSVNFADTTLDTPRSSIATP